MNDFEKKKLKEIALYILSKTKGVDIYHLLKILYFAEKKHLLNWGCSMVGLNFQAWEHGPVQPELYRSVKQDKEFNNLEEDASSVIFAVREPDMDYITDSYRECLDESILENYNLSFSQLREKSHDSAWEEAYNSDSKVMSILSIAKAAGANDGMMEYIQEMSDFEKAFC